MLLLPIFLGVHLGYCFVYILCPCVISLFFRVFVLGEIGGILGFRLFTGVLWYWGALAGLFYASLFSPV